MKLYTMTTILCLSAAAYANPSYKCARANSDSQRYETLEIQLEGSPTGLATGLGKSTEPNYEAPLENANVVAKGSGWAVVTASVIDSNAQETYDLVLQIVDGTAGKAKAIMNEYWNGGASSESLIPMEFNCNKSN